MLLRAVGIHDLFEMEEPDDVSVRSKLEVEERLTAGASIILYSLPYPTNVHANCGISTVSHWCLEADANNRAIRVGKLTSSALS